MEAQNPNVSREMIQSFMEEMTPTQLDKLCTYACKIVSDKRYKKQKKDEKPKPNY